MSKPDEDTTEDTALIPISQQSERFLFPTFPPVVEIGKVVAWLVAVHGSHFDMNLIVHDDEQGDTALGRYRLRVVELNEEGDEIDMSDTRPTLEQSIDNWFTYHPPAGDQAERYVKIRDAAKQFAKVIAESTPECADQTAALRKLRECVFTANAAIACNEKPV